MRGAAAPQQQSGFRRLATFQGVSVFWARGGGGGREKEETRGRLTSARATCGALRRP